MLEQSFIENIQIGRSQLPSNRSLYSIGSRSLVHSRIGLQLWHRLQSFLILSVMNTCRAVPITPFSPFSLVPRSSSWTTSCTMYPPSFPQIRIRMPTSQLWPRPTALTILPTSHQTSHLKAHRKRRTTTTKTKCKFKLYSRAPSTVTTYGSLLPFPPSSSCPTRPVLPLFSIPDFIGNIVCNIYIGLAKKRWVDIHWETNNYDVWTRNKNQAKSITEIDPRSNV